VIVVACLHLRLTVAVVVTVSMVVARHFLRASHSVMTVTLTVPVLTVMPMIAVPVHRDLRQTELAVQAALEHQELSDPLAQQAQTLLLPLTLLIRPRIVLESVHAHGRRAKLDLRSIPVHRYVDPGNPVFVGTLGAQRTDPLLAAATRHHPRDQHHARDQPGSPPNPRIITHENLSVS
jgi:hypothetical protein